MMTSTVRHCLDAFIERRRTLIREIHDEGETFSWKEEYQRFVIESAEAHIILTLILDWKGADAAQILSILYRRAQPQWFMGLPIRVCHNDTALIGSLAIPAYALTTENLLQLHRRLCQMFDPETLHSLSTTVQF
jgi:hypothetical protein